MVHSLPAQIQAQGEDFIQLSVELPVALQSKSVVLAPTIWQGLTEAEDELDVTLIDNVLELRNLAYTYDPKRLSDESRGTVRAWETAPKSQSFTTTGVRLPQNAELQVGLAVGAACSGEDQGNVRFVILAISKDQETELLNEVLPLAKVNQWLDRKIDLSKLGGEVTTFRFLTTTTSTDSERPTTTASPRWGTPRVLVESPESKRRNVVLISLDTLRADHLGGQYQGIPLTPWLDQLAAQGTRFDQALSTFSSTAAAHMSLFTGTYPATHGVRYPINVLPNELTTLPQKFQASGYSTAAVTENAMIAGGSGFARGFDFYRENRERLRHAGGIDRTLTAGVDWIQAHRNERYFLFLHTYEVHTPYTPTPHLLSALPPVAEDGLTRQELTWANNRRAYAAEVLYSDRALRRFFGEMKRLQLLDDTLVVIVSDHGEEFGEHGGSFHSRTLFDEILRIPVLFWAPGFIPEGQRIGDQVSLIDLPATIVDFMGLAPLTNTPGQSLKPLILNGSDLDGEVRFAEGFHDGHRQVAARTPAHKWLWREGKTGLEVYDLQADAQERTPLSDPQLLAQGQELIDDYLALDRGRTTPPEREVDNAVQHKLKALGYID